VKLLQLLEMRLDNIVFRLNMAPTIVAARQLICHGHIRVNQNKVNIASYKTKRCYFSIYETNIFKIS
jgi:small subunit ribosomal protein S4